jgi:SAM-dependent methyltransferase
MSTRKVNYGLDAPGLARGFLIAGIVLIPLGYIAARQSATLRLNWLNDLGSIAVNTGFGCLCGALLMLFSSYFGKLRHRDSILDRLHLLGDEAVLDVGCGHGLLLIGATKRLPRGRAVGIDLWSQTDQSDNSHEATLRNAEIEGLTGRVEIRDGDMRKLPFPGASFDAAMAHFAIHNIPSREGRREAIREIVRTLKPGGRVALSDWKSTGLYAEELRRAGMSEVKTYAPSFWTWPPSRTVTAIKPLVPSPP